MFIMTCNASFLEHNFKCGAHEGEECTLWNLPSHPSNALESTDSSESSMPSPNVRDASLKQWENALLPIERRDPGKWSEWIRLHERNALLPIACTEVVAENVTSNRFTQRWKAFASMVVTWSGMTTLMISLRSLNAYFGIVAPKCAKSALDK